MKEELELVQYIASYVTYFSIGALIGYTGKCLRIKRQDQIKYGIIDSPPARTEQVHHHLNKNGVKKEASIIINEFLNMANSRGFDVDSLYENFGPCAITETKSKNIGSFDACKQKLIVDADDLRSTLLRALLDAASTRVFPFYTYSGFDIKSYRPLNNERKEIRHFGFGLNEAYKDVLLKRYFGISYRYPKLADIARLLELHVGQKVMENAFFRGDLRAVLDTPESPVLKSDVIPKTKYYSFEKVVSNIVADLDTLYKPMYHEGLVQRSKSEKIYRRVLLKASKTVVFDVQAKMMASSSSICTEYVRGTAMMQELNAVLERSHKEVIFEPGLQPKDLEELVEYADRRLHLSPIKLNVERRK